MTETCSNRSCFVLGPHRSGTTILSSALAGSGEFVYLTAADIVAFHRGGDQVESTLGKLVHEKETRGIDDVQLSEDLPEEYGFLLPGRRLTEDSAHRVVSVYRDLAGKRGHDGMFLLRNPWDLSRAVLIHELFPQAFFVFVVRDPVATINSQLQAVRTLFTEPSEYHGLLDPRYRRIVRRKRVFGIYRRVSSRGMMVDLLLRSFRRSTEGLIRNLNLLPRERWIVTKYEDLVSEPWKELARLYEFLGLPPSKIPRMASDIRPSGRSLDPHVTARIPRIRKRTRLFRQMFGY